MGWVLVVTIRLAEQTPMNRNQWREFARHCGNRNPLFAINANGIWNNTDPVPNPHCSITRRRCAYAECPSRKRRPYV